MSAVAPSSDQAAELLQNLSLDSQNKTLQGPEPTKKTAAVQFVPVDPSTQTNGLSIPFERSTTPFMDPSMFYNNSASPTYYYAGFNGSSVNEWDRYTSPNGVDMSHVVSYSDYPNGFGYPPFAPYSSSGSPMGHDSQLYAPQHYQYPTSYFQPSGGPYTPNRANTSQADVSTSVGVDQSQLATGTAKGNQSSVGNAFTNQTNISKPVRSNYHNPPLKPNEFYGWGGLPPASSVNSSAFTYGNNFSSGRNQNSRTLPHFMGLQHPQAASGMDQSGFMNQMYPNNRMYAQYPSMFRRGYASDNYDPRMSSRGSLAVDNKYKSRGRSNGLLVYGNGSLDGLNELNKGPRAKVIKDLKDSEPITLAVKGQSLPLKGKNDEDDLPVFSDRDQYNRDDFPETHQDARFFIIKSYSEDDVHKSIKYGVWTSTPNGNKKLDAAYKEAQEKSTGCPIFLLFSVNASGQFVGLAEMVGPVDFDRTVEYWQQDKWTGCFPVKWHIVKDVPNSMLRYITLENNENKPVTNSRDTQEVKVEQGAEIIKIFKGHSSRTCILDDFEFYEGRQRTMQERKARQKQFNKQGGDLTVEVAEKCGLVSNQGLEGSLDIGSALTADPADPTAAGPGVVETSGDSKFLKDNGPAAKAEPALSSSKENKAISDGASNTC